MASFSKHHFMTPRTIEVSRFPGWKLHVREDMMSCDIQMVAIRESDGKRLEYSEPVPLNGDRRVALQRLSARLGEDFLDLVPLETEQSSHCHSEKP